MKAVIVIPARLESTRLPRKLLLNETGKPLLQHTWEQAMKVGLDVIVGTDSDEIWDACYGFGAHAIMTPNTCRNGTERVAEVAEEYPADVVVCWQADEPEIDPKDVANLIELDTRDSCCSHIATLAAPINPQQALDENRTKVVLNNVGQAMYFSRSRIPYRRLSDVGFDSYLQHVGVYAYRRHVLMEIAKLDLLGIEATESLEQLRWLINYYTIDVALLNDLPNGINTREDYDAFVQRQKVMV